MVQDEAGARRLESPTHENRWHAMEGGMRADLVAGGRFPDLELPDHRQESVKLSQLADGFPLILSFYRGYW